MFKSAGNPSGRVRGNLDPEVQSVFIESMNTPSRFGSAHGRYVEPTQIDLRPSLSVSLLVRFLDCEFLCIGSGLIRPSLRARVSRRHSRFLGRKVPLAASGTPLAASGMMLCATFLVAEVQRYGGGKANPKLWFD